MAITKYIRRRPIHSDWRNLEAMSNRMSQVFNTVPFLTDSVDRDWEPHVDVIETDEELTLTAELPGLSENDVTINLENSVLSVSGEKTAIRNEDETEQRSHVWERRYGSFNRSFTLPRTVSTEDIGALFENGVLTIHMPKVPGAKGRTIEICKN
ncbi:MAG: Hsp20/alpha crystallin family protein [bacterium]|jgi:HSP20 family protein|nr:Hsp20/alpha crystallin family protein [Gemmatimonadota bacterium]HIL88957.1 Hsp20/alpha crystallin family protein [Gemmatimonadota bacterium]